MKAKFEAVGGELVVSGFAVISSSMKGLYRWAKLGRLCGPMPRRHFEDEPADVRTLRAVVNMPLVSIFAIRTVRLHARQAHSSAVAIRTFPMIEI